MAPSGILATTFTRKAAQELRSRILSWGYSAVREALARAQQTGDAQLLQWLRGIDVNAVQVGTLDSLSEQLIIDARPPGGITPATIESFLCRGLMRRVGLFPHRRFQNRQLERYLNSITPHFPYARAFADKLTILLSFTERVRHDSIDLQAFSAVGPGEQVMRDVVDDYLSFLVANHLSDFAAIETVLLSMLRQGHLNRLTNSLQAVLVDEFQDTNFLQEQIYFELCSLSNMSLTVVGDDDQSIFRFRGATVEIFANFNDRIVHALGAAWRPTPFNLSHNYRATQRIVDFCNSFVQSDAAYQIARTPNKVPLVASALHANNPIANLPVLGMFRPDCTTLADSLGTLLHDVFRGPGFRIACDGAQFELVRAQDGDFGDAVFLSRSVRELAANDRERLPLLLRRRLEALGVRVFNPRGRSLGGIEPVRQLLGLALECIDPSQHVQDAIGAMSPATRATLSAWRQDAIQLMNTNPAPGALQLFVQSWQQRIAAANARWPREWPLLELMFTLVTWIPELQSDPEGQVYLEAVTRTVAEVGQMASYRARILNDTGPHDANSVRELLREVFEGIATETVDIDEEIMPDIPRNYFPMMTIFQAKGLEFPLVIVDVGSDFQRNHHAQARFRFPIVGDNVHVMEDAVGPYCPIGPARTLRPAVDRAWDDLRRLYFVSYSRPQVALLLVGLMSQLRQGRPVPSIATGDLRTGARAITFVSAEQWNQNSGPLTVALI